MNLEALRLKLIGSARRVVPSDRVPFAFEKQVMRRLGAVRPGTLRVPDAWAAWGGVLWRAVVPSAAVMLVVMVGSLLAHPPGEDRATMDPLAQVLLAGLETGADAP